MTQVWVTGKCTDPQGDGWEVQGVFTSEARAVAACRDARYFVGPIALDEELPEETVEWTGAYYPHQGVDK